MKLIDFLELNKSVAVDIPVSEIALTSNTHIKDTEKGKTVTGTLDDNAVIVVNYLSKPKSDGIKYSLVTGWKTYMIAKNTGVQLIKAIIVPYNRRRFLNYLAKKPVGNIALNVINAEQFRIPPSNTKLNFIRQQCDLLGGNTIDSPVTIRINQYGEVKLIDGYARYLVAKERGIDLIPFATMAKG